MFLVFGCHACHAGCIVRLSGVLTNQEKYYIIIYTGLVSHVLLHVFSSNLKMPKRTASDALLNGQANQPFNKMPATGIRRETHPIDEMGEFEDAWEDEIESDQEVVDVDEERDDGGCASFTCEYSLHAIIAFRNGC